MIDIKTYIDHERELIEVVHVIVQFSVDLDLSSQRLDDERITVHVRHSLTYRLSTETIYMSPTLRKPGLINVR